MNGSAGGRLTWLCSCQFMRIFGVSALQKPMNLTLDLTILVAYNGNYRKLNSSSDRSLVSYYFFFV